MKPTTIKELKDYDGAVLVCMPTKWPGQHTESSVVRACQFCGQDIWVSKSGFISSGGDPLLLCIPCLEQASAKDSLKDAEFMEVTEAQFMEIKKVAANNPTLKVPETLEELRAKMREILNKKF